jgi:ferritin-like metal-binding protein YciE
VRSTGACEEQPDEGEAFCDGPSGDIHNDASSFMQTGVGLENSDGKTVVQYPALTLFLIKLKNEQEELLRQQQQIQTNLNDIKELVDAISATATDTEGMVRSIETVLEGEHGIAATHEDVVSMKAAVDETNAVVMGSHGIAATYAQVFSINTTVELTNEVITGANGLDAINAQITNSQQILRDDFCNPLSEYILDMNLLIQKIVEIQQPATLILDFLNQLPTPQDFINTMSGLFRNSQAWGQTLLDQILGIAELRTNIQSFFEEFTNPLSLLQKIIKSPLDRIVADLEKANANLFELRQTKIQQFRALIPLCPDP